MKKLGACPTAEKFAKVALDQILKQMSYLQMTGRFAGKIKKIILSMKQRLEITKLF